MRMIKIAGLSIACLCAINVFAKSPDRQHCEQFGDNTQCAYQVEGQNPNQPIAESTLYAMTDMPYALCSSAKCDIDKQSSNKATCHCNVFGLDEGKDAWRNASVGPYNYERSKPAKRKDVMVSVTSNFSFANITRKSDLKSHACKFDEPVAWANCFGVRCNVKPLADGNYEAVCQCPLVKSNRFISMGPAERSDCKLEDNQAWSAATAKQGDNDFAVIQDIYKTYYPKSPAISGS